MADHVKRSTLPIYAVGAVWLIFGAFFSLYRPADYVLCGVISLVVFIAAKAVFPDKRYTLPGEPPAEEKQAAAGPEKAREKAQTQTTGDPEVDKLIRERDRAVSEMRRLNDSIQDEVISGQIDHLEEVTRQIMDQVVKDPKKLPQIRRFLNYFLPTTLKILNAYDRMDATGISGENIDGTKKRVEEMLGTIVQAFDKQLDSLFGAEAMDISSDITVMENLLAQEGLKDKNGDGGVRLEL